MSERSCAFCDIDSESERIINRTDCMTSFLSRPRLIKGHVLVVPNRHVVLPDALTDHEIVVMQREADRLTSVMLGSMALGVDRWQKTRPAIPEGTGNKMDHVHIHVLPSTQGDVLYDEALAWGDTEGWVDLSQSECLDMVALLRPQTNS